METIDPKVLAADEQSFRFYAASLLSALGERVTAMGDRVMTLAKEVEMNRDRLVQMDLGGTHGLGDLRERVAAHEKWMDDIRKALTDHMTNCPMFGRIETMDTKVEGLVVSRAELLGAKGQKESDWRTTLSLVAILLTLLFSGFNFLQRTGVIK